MRRGLLTRVIVVLVAVIVVSLAFASATGPEHPGHPRPYFGIAYGNTLAGMSDGQLARSMDDAVDLGATAVRADLDWNDVQPESAAEFRWATTDRVVDAAGRRDLGLILVVVGTPPWARAVNCTRAFCAPADPARFAAFAGAAAARYPSSRVLAWEVWNEPNTAGFWWPKPDPGAYTTLLVDTARAIRAEDPDATILLGGLAAVDNGAEVISQSDFLTAVCERGGNGVVDGVAFHPYTYPDLASRSRNDLAGPWSRISNSSNSLRSVLTRFRMPAMPIWITEFGAPTGGPGAGSDGSSPAPPDTTHVTEEQQARIAADVVTTVLSDPGIAALIWYSDRDLSTDTSTNLNFYGLRRADGSPKPAFDALSRAIALRDRTRS